MRQALLFIEFFSLIDLLLMPRIKASEPVFGVGGHLSPDPKLLKSRLLVNYFWLRFDCRPNE